MTQLTRQITLAELLPDAQAELGIFPVSGIALDSRRVHAGHLFLAVGGSNGHGATYIDQAIGRGAHAVAVEADGAGIEWREHEGRRVPVVSVPGLRAHLGTMADRFFHHPSRDMTVVGVTGTNGKSSVTHFIAEALGVDAPCGLIGTLGSGLMGQLRDTGLTTPDTVTLHAEFASFRAAGAGAAAMEVSSHALDQGRVDGVAFEIAVFTNLTHDHLDYHGTMANYAAAKRRLLGWPGLRGRVINVDDPIGVQWHREFSAEHPVIGFGMGDGCRSTDGDILYARGLEFSARGLRFEVDSPFGNAQIESGLMGRFNVSNLLATLGALLLAKVPFAEAARRLCSLHTVPGRIERIDAGQAKPLAVIDYAHTPDALEQVLIALRDHLHGERKLWCVFGCGGDRDRLKRPLMGRIAEMHADHVVVTDDNPRSEEPASIIDAILQGMRSPDAAHVIGDRAEAIARALELAAPGDIVLVAGRGHETMQIRGDLRIPFSDRAEVAHILGVSDHG